MVNDLIRLTNVMILKYCCSVFCCFLNNYKAEDEIFLTFIPRNKPLNVVHTSSQFFFCHKIL